jgi:cobalt-zinc-cadmium efflux system membrane fusion protein
MNLNPFKRAALLCVLLLVGLLSAVGCGTRTAEKEAHEEHKAGPHGGPLVELSPEAVHSAGIDVGSVGPHSIEVVVELPGEIKLNAERSIDVRPTYPGRVRLLHAGLGTFVHRGQPLAVIYSNESLSDYTIEAPMSGTVVARPVNPGAAVDHESVLYTLADLTSVWLDFPIYVQHLGRIRRGQIVHVRAEGGRGGDAVGTISYVGPVLDVDTRTTFGRVVLPNRSDQWQPGRLVTASVVLERVTVPIAVPEDAIVRMGSGAAVFRADTSGFEMQPVILGRTDGVTTEIVSGLERGARVVTRNAFLVKAELEKETGGHED